MILSFAQWIQSTGVFTALRSSAYVYSYVLAFHLCAIALFGGMIVLSDLCLLGWTPKRIFAVDVVNGLRIPKRIGFVVTATLGFFLFSAKAEQYYYNPWLRTKLVLFALVAAHALIFRRLVYNRLGEAMPNGIPALEARMAGLFSLLIWACVITAGREIGYVLPAQGLHF